MLYKYYKLSDSLSSYKDYQNVCFYNSFYIYIKQYYENICDFDTFLNFNCTNDNKDFYTNIESFLKNYSYIYSHLIKKHYGIKKILDNLVLGITTLNNDNKNIVEITHFIKLYNIIKNGKISFTNKLSISDKPIIILNDNDHFEPIIIYK